MRAGSRAIAGDACFISARRSALRALTLGSKLAMPATWMNSFLRLLEARDRIALPGRLTFPVLLLSAQAAAFAPDAVVVRTFLLRALGARGLHAAAPSIVEGGVLAGC